jgi:hypothetical protein
MVKLLARSPPSGGFREMEESGECVSTWWNRKLAHNPTARMPCSKDRQQGRSWPSLSRPIHSALSISTEHLELKAVMLAIRIPFMIKPSLGLRSLLMLTVAYSVNCVASDETHAIYPPLQIFKEL